MSDHEDNCNELATCGNVVLTIPAQRDHTSDTTRRGCTVRLTLDPHGSFALSGTNKFHTDVDTFCSTDNLLFHVNLSRVKSYSVSGTRNTLHTIVMANGRTFQLSFEDIEQFGKFKQYLRVALESLNLSNTTDDFLCLEQTAPGRSSVEAGWMAGTNISQEQDRIYLTLLSTEETDEKIDSLDETGYEKICEAKMLKMPPNYTSQTVPPIPKRNCVKLTPSQMFPSNQRRLPPPPPPNRTGNEFKLSEVGPKSPRRCKSEDWSQDNEGYELPLQLRSGVRNIHHSNSNVHDYTSIPQAPAAISGSLQHLNEVLVHPRVVYLTEPGSKTRQKNDPKLSKLKERFADKKEPILCISEERQTRMQHAQSHDNLSIRADKDGPWSPPVPKTGRTEARPKVEQPTKMQHTQSHNNLSIQAESDGSWSPPHRKAGRTEARPKVGRPEKIKNAKSHNNLSIQAENDGSWSPPLRKAGHIDARPKVDRPENMQHAQSYDNLCTRADKDGSWSPPGRKTGRTDARSKVDQREKMQQAKSHNNLSIQEENDGSWSPPVRKPGYTDARSKVDRREMQHAQSHNNLSIQEENVSSRSYPILEARSVISQPFNVTPSKNTPNCARSSPPPPPPRLRHIPVSTESAYKESTLTASCPESIAMFAHNPNILSSNPLVREALSISLMSPITCSVPNLASDVTFSPTLSKGSLWSSTIHLGEAKQKQLGFLKFHTNVKQTVIHTNHSSHRFYPEA